MVGIPELLVDFEKGQFHRLAGLTEDPVSERDNLYADTDAVRYDTGAFASTGVSVAGSATLEAAQRLRAQVQVLHDEGVDERAIGGEAALHGERGHGHQRQVR